MLGGIESLFFFLFGRVDCLRAVSARPGRVRTRGSYAASARIGGLRGGALVSWNLIYSELQTGLDGAVETTEPLKIYNQAVTTVSCVPKLDNSPPFDKS